MLWKRLGAQQSQAHRAGGSHFRAGRRALHAWQAKGLYKGCFELSVCSACCHSHSSRAAAVVAAALHYGEQQGWELHCFLLCIFLCKAALKRYHANVTRIERFYYISPSASAKATALTTGKLKLCRNSKGALHSESSPIQSVQTPSFSLASY